MEANIQFSEKHVTAVSHNSDRGKGLYFLHANMLTSWKAFTMQGLGEPLYPRDVVFRGRIEH